MPIKQFLQTLIIVLTGASLTFLIHSQFDLHPALASATLTLTFSVFEGRIKITHALPLFFIGSFIGMGDFFGVLGIPQIILASLISTSIYHKLDNKLEGLSGRLGTIAFIGAVISFILTKAI